MSKKKILIIIPAYNEQESIEETLLDLKANFPDGDVVVVNDGSLDNTSGVAKKCGAFVIDLIHNLGIGGAVQTGYLYAEKNNYDVAVQFDGDGQHIAKEIPGLISPIIEDRADMVIGSRFLEDVSFKSTKSRLLGIKFLSLLIKMLTGKTITDSTSGFRAVNKETISFFARNYPDDYPEPDVAVRLLAMDKKVLEVKADMNQRNGGTSSITSLNALVYMIKVSLSMIVNIIRGKKYYI